MNAAFEMSRWVLALTTIVLIRISTLPVNTLSTNVHRQNERKLFGGYRIVPKWCLAKENGKTGICMFNYECTQRGGQMIGSCVDGFLFGACCSLPQSEITKIVLPDLESDDHAETDIPGNNVYVNVGTTDSSENPATTQRAGASKTTIVHNIYTPTITDKEVTSEAVSALIQHLNGQEGGYVDTTGFILNEKYPGADTVLLNPDGTVFLDEINDPDALFTKAALQTTTVKPEIQIVTDEYDGFEAKTTTDVTDLIQKLSTSLLKSTGRPLDDRKTTIYDKLVPVSTIPHKSEFKTRRPTTSEKYPSYNYNSLIGSPKPSITFGGSESTSINHIIGILNENELIGKVTTPATAVTNGGGLSTWVSIIGNKKPWETTSKPVKKHPTSGTISVHGPSLTVENNEEKPIPTVIVISPPGSDQTAIPIITRSTTTTEKLIIATRRPPFLSSSSSPLLLSTTRVPLQPPNRPDNTIPSSSGQEQLVNFPPVRNPDLNISTLSQVEKPTIVQTESVASLPSNLVSSIEIVDDPEINTIDPYDDYDDITTPELDDTKVGDKVHTFVEKIVNSLAGNFQDLENVLFKNENKTKISNPNGIELNNVLIGDSTQPPTKKPTTTTTTTTTTTPRTTTTTTTTTKKPTKKPTTASTTKKPVTKKPKPTTTKRPKTTSTTTTTVSTTSIEYDEVTELAQSEDELTTILHQLEGTTLDFRKECGVRPLIKNKGGRIVGGKGATFGSYPWQVLVRESTWLGLFTKNKCGGVLITNKYVVTAAHCQPGFLASLVAVFGEFDISGELESKRSVSKNVRRVIVHRQYDPATFENDLALLELDSPINYDEHILPICMPKDGEDYVGRMATVTGWGRLKYGGGVPSVLQEVRVPLIENSVCQEMFQTAGHQKRIISSFLCAGYANGQKDSCEGDSGGPLMVERDDGRWTLLGTVSHGIKCASPYLPGVYMRTTYYKPWLKSITGVNT